MKPISTRNETLSALSFSYTREHNQPTSRTRRGRLDYSDCASSQIHTLSLIVKFLDFGEFEVIFHAIFTTFRRMLLILSPSKHKVKT